MPVKVRCAKCRKQVDIEKIHKLNYTGSNKIIYLCNTCDNFQKFYKGKKLK